MHLYRYPYTARSGRATTYGVPKTPIPQIRRKMTVRPGLSPTGADLRETLLACAKCPDPAIREARVGRHLHGHLPQAGETRQEAPERMIRDAPEDDPRFPGGAELAQGTAARLARFPPERREKLDRRIIPLTLATGAATTGVLVTAVLSLGWATWGPILGAVAIGWILAWPVACRVSRLTRREDPKVDHGVTGESRLIPVSDAPDPDPHAGAGPGRPLQTRLLH
jgi:hypothetical protein